MGECKRSSRLGGSDIICSDLDCLCLRNPEYFIAGGLHHSLEAWGLVFQEHPLRDSFSDWIKNKVDIFKFSQPFTGVCKKVRHSSILPPQKQFRNHVSCKNFNEFISNKVINRVRTGAFRVWGEVGVDDPPHLVLPLTVEPSKPRLCLDARFLNLWMRDAPFSFDKLSDVTRFVYPNSFMKKCDDKSGYERVLLSEASQSYFGFSFGGLWFICTTIWLHYCLVGRYHLSFTIQ